MTAHDCACGVNCASPRSPQMTPHNRARTLRECAVSHARSAVHKFAVGSARPSALSGQFAEIPRAHARVRQLAGVGRGIADPFSARRMALTRANRWLANGLLRGRVCCDPHYRGSHHVDC
jgi:hypothetical protein